MKAVIICGMTGTGKSTKAKELMNSLKNQKFIYDVNNEHGGNSHLPKIEEFIAMVKPKKNCVILFEEATIFFSNRSANPELVDMLVRKRHTNQFIILLFHSLRTIPRNVMDLCNFLILFKTNDSGNLVERKFENENIDNAFQTVNTSPDKHKNFTVSLNN